MIIDEVNKLIPKVMMAKGKSLDALRLIKSELVSAKYKKKGEWTEDDEIDVLLRMTAQSEENIVKYLENGRKDLAEKEQKDLEVVKSLTPKQPTPEEIQAFTEAVLDEYIKSKGDGFSVSMKDVATVYSIVKEKYPRVERKCIVDAINRIKQ